jgi:hypothetical protein
VGRREEVLRTGKMGRFFEWRIQSSEKMGSWNLETTVELE